MKEPKNLRIVLAPVGQFERRDVENIENSAFRSKVQIILHLFHIIDIFQRKGHNNNVFQILTADEFRAISNKKTKDAFDAAMLNINKRSKTQCYNLSEFVDEYNNQEFKGKTDRFWIGYVKLK